MNRNIVNHVKIKSFQAQAKYRQPGGADKLYLGRGLLLSLRMPIKSTANLQHEQLDTKGVLMYFLGDNARKHRHVYSATAYTHTRAVWLTYASLAQNMPFHPLK